MRLVAGERKEKEARPTDWEGLVARFSSMFIYNLPVMDRNGPHDC